jgi:hypothetical protein
VTGRRGGPSRPSRREHRKGARGLDVLASGSETFTALPREHGKGALLQLRPTAFGAAAFLPELAKMQQDLQRRGILRYSAQGWFAPGVGGGVYFTVRLTPFLSNIKRG